MPPDPGTNTHLICESKFYHVPLQDLPAANLNALWLLLETLNRVAADAAENEMDARALATAVAPCLAWHPPPPKTLSQVELLCFGRFKRCQLVKLKSIRIKWPSCLAWHPPPPKHAWPLSVCQGWAPVSKASWAF